MAKNSIRDYSATNSLNTDIQSIDISEGCSPAGINNAIREVMADLKDVSTGAVALESPSFDQANFADNAKAIFGAGSDLQIYHDGSNSIIDDTDGGRLYLRSYPGVIISKYTGETCAQFNADADVKLYYDNAEKLSTTATGVDVTGGLNATGNVGIGTSSPSQSLSLYANDTTDTQLIIEQDSTGDAGIQFSLTDIKNWTVGVDNSDGDKFKIENGNTIGSSNDFVIDSSGRVHVNQTSDWASSMLSAYATGAPALSARTNQTNGTCLITRHDGGGTAYNVQFYNGASFVGSIQTTASSTSYVTSSDYRLKENVTDITDATTRLKQLNPVRFNFIADADTTVDGFLAHEVQAVVPEAISGTKDAMRDEEYQVSVATGDIYTPAVEATYDDDGVELTAAVDEVIHSADVERPEELAEGQQWRETTAAVMGTRSVPDYQGIDQSKLVPLLVKTIQELEARITALEAN